jgi:hypothetical protein
MALHPRKMVRTIIAAVRTALPKYYKIKLTIITIFRTDLFGAMLATVLFRKLSSHGLSRDMKLGNVGYRSFQKTLFTLPV